MYKVNTPEPIEGLPLREIGFQLDRFLDYIDQISLEEPRYHELHKQAVIMKNSAEQMIKLARQKDEDIGPAVQCVKCPEKEETGLQELILEDLEPAKGPRAFLQSRAKPFELTEPEKVES